MVHFQLIRNNIRGELTVAHTKEQFSLKDNSFIEAVASSLKISSSKVRLIWVAPTRSLLSKLIIAYVYRYSNKRRSNKGRGASLGIYNKRPTFVTTLDIRDIKTISLEV